MKLLKKLSLGFLILIALLFLISFVLPQKQQVERSIEISASAEKIFPHLSNPKLFHEWSPWTLYDPDMKVVFTGPESGKGAKVSWQSDDPNVGTGTSVVTEAVENQSLNFDMDFGDQGKATSFFTLKPTPTDSKKTQVTWGFEVDTGNNPIMRWMGLMMDKMVGSEYQKGLEALKKMIEK